ncbi:MAG: response regulator [Acidimicrobiales bacterium]
MTEFDQLRVLLVEDNELDARTMERVLSNSSITGFSLHRVDTLGGALDVLGQEAFDCILLDLSLPDSEGLVSVDALTTAAAAPIVVLTGLDDPETALEAVERGAQDYLTKQHLDGELVARSLRYAVARNHSESQLRSAHQLLDVLRDRERIGRDLHDNVIQRLFATGMSLQAILARVVDPDVRASLDGAIGEIDESIRGMREAIFGLHTATAEMQVAEQVERIIASHREPLGFDVTVRIGTIPDLPDALRSDVVAVVSEAIANMAKHSGATAATVSIEVVAGELVVCITDNGRGMESASLVSEESEAGRTGRGLHNLRARAKDLGGSFQVHAGTGGGTEVEWSVPLPSS